MFSFALFFHIVGITLLAGGAVGGLILERQLYRYVLATPDKAIALAPLMSRYPVVIQIGAVVMLLSGLTMLAALHWIVVSQDWFIIKMILYVGLILNGSLVARPTGLQLKALIMQPVTAETNSRFLSLKRKMTIFHITEFSMLIAIYLLAIYRF
ncbi:MAG TPA: DUF2269 family protein [Hanamia sp.]|jgi:Predicted integral membrane protein (DUF2269)|nr:DUF2269 family protein [Hanamia sp.]